MKSRIYHIVFFLVTVFALISGLVYWEFAHDIDPKEAIEFFSPMESIPDDENGVFALAGIAAPLGTKNVHAWGYAQVMKNRDRFQRDVDTVNILDDEPAVDDRLYLKLEGNDVNLKCWLPGDDRKREDDKCISDAAVRALIETNREIIDRYKNLFRYQHLYIGLGDGTGVGHTFVLSRLLIVDSWLNKNILSDEDLSTIFSFFRFWEKASRNGQTLLSTAISMVNYRLASILLARLSEEKPDILTRYNKLYGRFHSDRVNEAYFDNWNKAEFNILNEFICLIRPHDEFRTQHVLVEKSWNFKPGRTVQLIYENRQTHANCTPSKGDRNSRRGLSIDYWAYLFMRPGNSRGRAFAAIYPGFTEKSCKLSQQLDRRAEENGFRNLYLHFRLSNYTSEQIGEAHRNNKELFRIKGTDRFYLWDNEKHLLIWEQMDPYEKYTIPYL